VQYFGLIHPAIVINTVINNNFFIVLVFKYGQIYKLYFDCALFFQIIF